MLRTRSLAKDRMGNEGVTSSPGKSPSGKVVANVAPIGMLGILTPLKVADGKATICPKVFASTPESTVLLVSCFQFEEGWEIGGVILAED
jgi:hypothetical protein